jgi:hypothetical protein
MSRESWATQKSGHQLGLQLRDLGVDVGVGVCAAQRRRPATFRASEAGGEDSLGPIFDNFYLPKKRKKKFVGNLDNTDMVTRCVCEKIAKIIA